MSKKGLICMAFDGSFVTEKKDEFNTVNDAWKHAEDMGSRWFFYPFCFVTSASGQSVIDTPANLEFLKGKRVKTVSRFFEKISQLPESKGVDVDTFLFILMDNQESL